MREKNLVKYKYLVTFFLVLLCFLFTKKLCLFENNQIYGYEIEETEIDEEAEEDQKTPPQVDESDEENEDELEIEDDSRQEEEWEDNEGNGEEDENESNEQNEDEERHDEDEEQNEEDDENGYIDINFDLIEIDFEIPTEDESILIHAVERTGSLGNWTDYNGIVFGEASLYDTVIGGGFAVSKDIFVYSDQVIGANYTSQYDPTKHIGEYVNEGDYPALLYGGDDLHIFSGVQELSVYGGSILMNSDAMEKNQMLENGFSVQEDGKYETMGEEEIRGWFEKQYDLAKETSELFVKANDRTITVEELSDGSYLNAGADAYKNKTLAYNNEIFENALFITVRTDREVNFGQWWPVYSIINLDMDWVLDYELVVFNFPDAVNVTMNSASFNIQNMEHWSTTVDAWIGDRGMQERLALAERVVYNFPKARSVEANQALIQGTVLAPSAAFTGVGVGQNGHVYGHIVVKDYYAQGNFTIHPFKLSHWAFDLVEDSIDREVKTGNIALRQYLYFNGQPTSVRLDGGGFHLTNEEGAYYIGDGEFTYDEEEAKEYFSSTVSQQLIENVPVGGYILQNTTPPKGFLINNEDTENTYTYAEYPVILNRANETVNVVRYTEPQFMDAYFKIIDENTLIGLEKAVFTIVREADIFEDTTFGSTYTSQQDGYFFSRNIPVGNYELIELEPPLGYELIPGGKFRFVVQWDETEDAMIITDTEENRYRGTKEDPIIIKNNSGTELNTAAIIKYAYDVVDPDTPLTLADAEFHLYKLNDENNKWEIVKQNIIGEPIEVITDYLGYYLIQNIENGYYRLIEIRAPAGYQLENQYMDENINMAYAYEFLFSEDTVHLIAYIENEPITTEITLQSIGVFDDDKGSIEADGISFSLERRLTGGAWEEVFLRGYTDFEGKLVIDNLQKGDYRLKQIDVPRGYYLLEPDTVMFNVSFDNDNKPMIKVVYDDSEVNLETEPIAFDDKTNTLTVKNKISARNLSIHKIDNDYRIGNTETGGIRYIVDYLEGAVFRLQRRISTRAVWRDYGESFESVYLYDENGEPVLDAYGNHIAAAVYKGGLLYGDYQLVEIESPLGYHTNSSIEVTLNDGTKGYQMHLFTITADMVEEGGESRFLIENYKKTENLKFRLVDDNDWNNGLSGGIFEIYPWNQHMLHELSVQDTAYFSESESKTFITDSNGYGSFQELITGEYLMVQSQAPQGFEIFSNQWFIRIDSKTNSIEIVEMSDQEEPQVLLPSDEGIYVIKAKRKYEMPRTGGSGIYQYWIFGVSLIVFSLSKLYFIRREVNENK